MRVRIERQSQRLRYGEVGVSVQRPWRSSRGGVAEVEESALVAQGRTENRRSDSLYRQTFLA